MDIHGLQKLTLLDFPGRTACTVFLAGCNLRCPFCHNSELLDRGTMPPVMDDGELLRFLEQRRGLLDGVCFTGGEPLLRPELPELMARVKALGYAVKLDTNGTLPERLEAILSAGLADYVAMDIKNGPTRYAEASGLAAMETEPVRRSIELLLRTAPDYEFRTTVVEQLHGEADFREIAELIRGAKRYALQAFADRDTVVFGGLSAPTRQQMEHYADIVRPAVGEVLLRGVD